MREITLLWLIAFLTLAFTIQSAGAAELMTWYVDDDAPADFDNIQEAIDAASPGDTIKVAPGTYWENVVVDKQLKLLADDPDTTIIDGGGSSHTVAITAAGSNSHVEGFTIQNGDWDGISLGDSHRNCITNNKVVENARYGICLYHSNYNTIIDCNVTSNGDYGIDINDSNNTLVGGNRITSNHGGIRIEGDSHYNKIHGNNVLLSLEQYDAITVWGSSDSPSPSNNTIVSNELIASGYDGIYLNRTCDNTVSDNTIEDSHHHGVEVHNAPNNTIENNVIKSNTSYGINLWDSNNVSIVGNEIFENSGGISLRDSDNAFIKGNKISDNEFGIGLIGEYSQPPGPKDCNIIGNVLTSNTKAGIVLWPASSNMIRQNQVIDCNVGIILVNESKYNRIYHNIFVNKMNAIVQDIVHQEYYLNYWDAGYPAEGNPKDCNCVYGGNFWSDYTGKDAKWGPNQDRTDSPDYPKHTDYRIGDTPYWLPLVYSPNNVDEYPLIFVAYKITTDPCSPQMKQPYLFNVNLTNLLTESVEFTGARQVAVSPTSASGWDLHPDDCLKPGPVTPCTIGPNETESFQMAFTNEWQWIPANDFRVIGDILCSLGSQFVGWSIVRFAEACYYAGKAVPEVTYTFEPMDGSSPCINFSTDVTVEVPDEKVQYLHNSLINQVAAIATSICGLFPTPLSPVFLVLGVGHTLAAIGQYEMAVDPDTDYTEIAQLISIAPPAEIEALPEGTAKQLALAALDLISLQMACKESYIHYDGARIAGDDEYTAKQLAAAINYNAMATEKLQEIQFLTPLVIADANIPTPTDANVVNYTEAIQADGLSHIQQYILEQAGLESQESNIIQVICDATKTAEQRQLYTNPDNLYNSGQTAVQNHYTTDYALEDAAEAQDLTVEYTNNVAVTNITPSETSVCKGQTLPIYVTVQNQGSAPLTDFEVTTSYDLIPNGNFEKDAVGTSFNNIYDWNHNSYDQFDANFVEYFEIIDSYYFSGSKSLYSYLKSNENYGPDSQSFVFQWLTTANPVSTTADYITLWICGVSFTTSSNYDYAIELHLTDGNKLSFHSLRRHRNHIFTKHYDNYDAYATGDDGQTWRRYTRKIPDNMDKTNLTIKILHGQASWNHTTASSWYHLDNIYFSDSNGNPQGGIETQMVPPLEPQTKTTLTFNWDTNDVDAGYYKIKAEAVLIDVNDDFPADNTRTSETIKVWVPDDNSPSDPCGLVCTDKTHNTISLAWNPSTDNVGIARYEVWRALFDDPCNAVLVGFAAATNCTFTNIGLDPGTWYTYWVSARDLNDNTSSLSDPCDVKTTAVLNLVYPNGGEMVPADMNSLIQWETIGDTGNIAIEYSINNGGFWKGIAVVANTGSHEWHSPDIYSTETQCLVRITDMDDLSLSDTSSLPFIIYNFPDIDGSCCIDFPDFAIVADHWSAADCNSTNHWCSQADLTRNGTVDFHDLALLIDDWLENMCYSPPL